MPDGQGYQVAPDELTAHASSLEDIGRTLGQAVSAAQQVTMGTQAYGMIAGPLFVPIVTAISSAGIDALSSSQSGVASLARGVKDTAASYHELDQDNATRLTSIHTPGDNS
jgi:imidazoleglycerol phosphate dehydratase HisB